MEFCSNLNKKQHNFENRNFFFENVNDKLTILLSLLKHEKYLSEEYDFLIRLKNMILYIAAQNCKIENFGHLNSINYLLKLLKELIEAKFGCIKKTISSNEYSVILEKLNDKLWNFRSFFNENILLQTEEFDEDIEKLNASMRCH